MEYETIDGFDYNKISLLISAGLYLVSFLYASLHVLLRTWILNEGNEDQQEGTSRLSTLLNQNRVSSDLPKANLLKLTAQIAIAFLFRLVWLLCTAFNIAPKPPRGEQVCHNAHVGLSAINRLAQLLLFSAFATLATFWAEICSRYEWNDQHQELNNEDEVAIAVARSTIASRTIVRATTVDANGEERTQIVQSVPPLNSLQIKSSKIFSLSMLLSPNFIQTIMNFWIYLTIFCLISVQFFQCDRKLNDSINDAETVVIAFFYMFLSAFLLNYGCKVVSVLSTFQLLTPQRKRIRITVVIICVLCISLFIVRAILFMLRPLFGYELSGIGRKIMYPWFFYTVPELFPALLVLFLATPKPKRRQLDAEVLPRAPNQNTPLITSENVESNEWI